MQTYQRAFFDFVIDCGALRFGEFTLKSGRASPYFFNAGLFNTGARLAQLGRYYAQAIAHAGVPLDVLFGPAYKGIPLAAATAIALATEFNRDIPFAFNRKEVKDHGEGGQLIGAALTGDVLVVDDVISAGLSVGESVDIIRRANARASGVVVALDRQERGQGAQSALQEVESRYGLRAFAIAGVTDLLEYLRASPGLTQHVAAIEEYRARYGA